VDKSHLKCLIWWTFKYGNHHFWYTLMRKHKFSNTT